jgi:pimeloyl-ACP methyl ester carboxylesterase
MLIIAATGPDRVNDIVLIHGGSTSGAVWSLMTPHLDGRALAVDLPGRNDPTDYATANFSDWARDVIRQMDAVGMERAALVAHSMGGGTMAGVARLFPERVRGVICFAAVVAPDGAPFLDGLSQSQREMMLRRRAEGEITLPRPVKSPPDEKDPRRRLMRDANSTEALGPFFERVSLEGFGKTRRALVKLTRDTAIEPERQDQFLARLRAFGPVEVREVDAGHMAMVTHPQESAAAINDIVAAFEQRAVAAPSV